MIHFFGDSWTAGCELNGYITEEFTVISQYNKHLADARQHEISCENIMKQMAYPSIVGSMLNIPIVNYGITASSQDRILYEFTHANINHGDHAVFALTAPTRKSYLDNDNNI